MIAAHTERFKVTSCGCFVYRNSAHGFEVLLTKAQMNHDVWGVPKGHRDCGEGNEQCAIREVKEETGIEVSVEDQLPFTVHHTPFNEEKTVIVFLAHQTDQVEAHAADSENVDVKWFSFDALPKLSSYQIPIIAAGIELVKMRSVLTHT